MNSRLFVMLTVLLVLPALNIVFAQEDETEEIVLTTYYPAPYGNYDELSANRWLQLNRTNYDTGELRLSASDSTGTDLTFWNLHNRGPDSGMGTIPGGDGNKLYLTYYDGTSWSGPHMVVTPYGDVGIGISSPGARLDVQGGSIRATDGLIIQTVSSQAEEDALSPVDGQIWLRTDISP